MTTFLRNELLAFEQFCIAAVELTWPALVVLAVWAVWYSYKQKGSGMQARDSIHVIPRFDDEPVHEESEKCWCHPIHDKQNQMDIETGNADCQLWVHNRRGVN